MGTIGA